MPAITALHPASVEEYLEPVAHMFAIVYLCSVRHRLALQQASVGAVITLADILGQVTRCYRLIDLLRVIGCMRVPEYRAHDIP
jgi:hypothetical protein